MGRKIKIGVIGVGQIGKHHLDNYSKIPDAEIVAISDYNEETLQDAAKRFNIPTTYRNFRDLLKRDDIEAVDVAVHNNLHAPLAIAALQAGKNVYCEKPMAGSYVDAKAMYDTAKKLGRKLHIQLSTLYEKEARVAHEIIEQGLLGEIYHARSTGFRRRGRPYVDGYGKPEFVKKEIASGGALYDMGVYHIACTLFLLGNPQALRMSGKTYQKIEMDSIRQKNSNYSVEEFVSGFVRLQNDMTLDILETWAVNLDNIEGSVILGSKGGVRLSPFGYFFNTGDIEFNATADLDSFIWRKNMVKEEGGVYASSQEHWVAALQERVELLPTAEIALNTMLISDGLYLSSQLNREVSVEEVSEMCKSTAIPVEKL